MLESKDNIEHGLVTQPDITFPNPDQCRSYAADAIFRFDFTTAQCSAENPEGGALTFRMFAILPV